MDLDTVYFLSIAASSASLMFFLMGAHTKSVNKMKHYSAAGLICLLCSVTMFVINL